MRNARIALCALVLAASGLSSAQEWGMSLFYDLYTKDTAIVATQKVATFTNVFKKGFTLDFDVFAGSYLAGNPVAGVSIGKRFQIADQAQAYFGFGASVRESRPVDFGPVIGVTVKF